MCCPCAASRSWPPTAWSASHYSFMGYILQPTELLTSTAPAIAARMAEEAVDIALLVPV